jgi:hypothetical protein
MLHRLRTNPQLLNYLFVTAGTLVPVLIYANMRSPSQEQVQDALVSVACLQAPPFER